MFNIRKLPFRIIKYSCLIYENYHKSSQVKNKIEDRVDCTPL